MKKEMNLSFTKLKFQPTGMNTLKDQKIKKEIYEA